MFMFFFVVHGGGRVGCYWCIIVQNFNAHVTHVSE